MKKLLCYTAIIIAVILGVVSCENELTPLGSNFLGEDPNNIIKEAEFDVKTYSLPVNPVQTNNFPSMPFGFYSDPVYGNSTYNFVSELNLGFQNPDVGNNVEVIDIKLDIPYFSTPLFTESTADQTVYELDSVYGNGFTQIEIYRSNYFLNSFDPNDISEDAVFYSNFQAEIENNLGELLYSDDAFIPSSQEVVVTETSIVDGEIVTDTIEQLSPRYRRSFSATTIDRWKEILFNLDPATGEIIDARAELANNNLFRDYFRGIYFKVVGTRDNGNLAHLNINEASIIVTIQSDSDVIDVDDVDGDGRTDDFIANPQSDIRLNFNGSRVSFINNEFNQEVITNITTSNNPTDGAEDIFLKGGPGSISVVELFGQSTNNTIGESPELTQVIQNEWIVNDAYIDFYVNLPDDQGSNEPERIIIYNYDTNQLLTDFAISSSSDPLNANLTHLGRLERITNEDGSIDGVYRIRLTQHLNNILAGNVENNRLGIAVSQNVSLIANNKVSNQGSNPVGPNIIPLSAAISHEGTILHGNLSPEIDKRPKLKIFYSETTN